MPNKENIYKQLNGRCAYCGKGMTLKDATRDHVVPKSKGGGNNVKNLLPTCKKCNQMKGDMSLDKFRLVFFKDCPIPRMEKFYFERVMEGDVKHAYDERTKKARRHFSEAMLRKMDEEPSYRAMMKILGLLAIAHEQLRIAVADYQYWDWDEPVLHMEEDYHMIVAHAENFRRIRNLFLDLVEVRYNTRNIISLEIPFLEVFPDEEIKSEINVLEKEWENNHKNKR